MMNQVQRRELLAGNVHSCAIPALVTLMLACLRKAGKRHKNLAVVR